MEKREEVRETARVTDRAEAVVITGKMVEAGAKVLGNSIGLGPGRAEELVREILRAALLARNNS